MKRILLMIILQCTTLALCAQTDEYFNNRLQDLKQQRSDIDKMQILHDLGKFFLFKSGNEKEDIENALHYFHQALNISHTLQHDKWTYETMLRIGEAHFQEGDTALANQYFKSVAQTYHAMKDVHREARTWLRWGRKIGRDNNPIVMAYFHKALEMYEGIHDSINQVVVLNSIAEVLIKQGNVTLAEETLTTSLNICELIHLTDNNRTGAIYLMGVLKRVKGDLNGSLQYSLREMQLMDSVVIDTHYPRATLSHSIALLYSELEQTEKSIQWYRGAIGRWLKKRDDDVDGFYLFQDAGNLAKALIERHHQEDALKEVLDLNHQWKPVTLIEKGALAQALGRCYSALKNPAKAEQQFNTMIDFYLKGDYYMLDAEKEEILSDAYFDLAQFYLSQNEFKKAGLYIDKVTQSFPKVFSLKKKRDAYRVAYKIDSASGQFISAMENFENHKKITETIFTREKLSEANAMELKYEMAKKENAYALLQKEGQLQSFRLKLTFVGIGLLIVTLALMGNQYIIKKKSNVALQEKQNEINKKNDTLQHLVNEKEWLLKEIHHRVKNNLQMIVSLLYDQSTYLSNGQALEAIQTVQHRISAISMIHQKLYHSANVSEINMAAYTAELVDYLKESFNPEHQIQFRLNVQSIIVDITLAIPLGLILNEAVTNSIKYAFPKGNKGIIAITFQESTPGKLKLTIADNGIGLPPDISIPNSNSMGINLITTLCTQMEGELRVLNENGTALILEFPYDKELTVLKN